MFKDTFPTISPNVQESSCQALSGCKLLTRLVTNFTPPLMAILPYFVPTHTAGALASGGGTLQRRVRVHFWRNPAKNATVPDYMRPLLLL